MTTLISKWLLLSALGNASGLLPSEIGEWGAVFPFPTLPIHSHLLPSGKVLFWDRHDVPDVDGHPRQWDPASGQFEMDAEPPEGHDLFCSGHTFLADGRLFAAGGHFEVQLGQPFAALYDPKTPLWTAAPEMNAGRWYPSATTLSDGRALVLSGTDEGAAPNQLPQIYDPRSDAWLDLTDALLSLPNYPMLFLAPDGSGFVAGPAPQARRLDVTEAGGWTDVATGLNGGRGSGSAAMYEPGRILVAGGGGGPQASAEVIDLNSPSPAFREVAAMSVARRHFNLTILADGTVLATGGTSLPGNNALGAVLASELWDPDTESWTSLASMSVPRLYHSVALLLPDARVLAAGGGHPSDTANGDPDHLDGEIFSPPYLFRGARPVILSARASVALGEAFVVLTQPDPEPTRVTWVRLSSVTHSFNMNQRFVELDSRPVPGGRLAIAPSSSHLAPPGHYLMFVLDAKGIPSVAAMVLLQEGLFSDGFERGNLSAWAAQ